MDKRITKIIFPLTLAIGMWALASGFNINNVAPGASSTPTPVPVGTVTPVKIVSCNQTKPGNIGISVCATNSGCNMMPAPLSSPCAAATPAPTGGTSGAGFPIAVCPSTTTLNSIQYGGPNGIAGVNIVSSEWDAVCSSASNVYSSTVP